MRSFIMAIGLLALALPGGALAVSVSEADRDVCDYPSKNPVASIRACSAIIDTIDVGYVRSIAYFNRGIAYKEKGDYVRAIADFNEAISLEPQYADAYFNRGVAYNAKGDYDSAIADFDPIISANPKDAEALLNRGNAYKNKGDYDRAIADFDEALRIDPKMNAAENARKTALSELAKRPPSR
jgi:tetratricopeptide (TPR) repeat protein